MILTLEVDAWRTCASACLLLTMTVRRGASVEASGIKGAASWDHLGGELTNLLMWSKMARWGSNCGSSFPKRVQKTDGNEGHSIAFRVAGVLDEPGRLPSLHPPSSCKTDPHQARARAAKTILRARVYSCDVDKRAGKIGKLRWRKRLTGTGRSSRSQIIKLALERSGLLLLCTGRGRGAPSGALRRSTSAYSLTKFIFRF